MDRARSQACIDQQNVSASLACLPVYLAGCKRLLVLAGPTYIERLWCIIEVYTFLQMGGEEQRIDIVPLGPAIDFNRFAVENAKCFDPNNPFSSALNKAKIKLRLLVLCVPK